MHLNQMPPLAWVAFVIIIVITVAIYFVLVALLRDPQRLRRIAGQKRMPRTDHTADSLRKATEVLRDPFAEENRKLNELSDLVQGLGKSGTSSLQENDQTQDIPKK